MREIRADFRRIYGTSYDDVPTEEAIDLLLMLPDGSEYAGAVSPLAAWSAEDKWRADVVDLLMVLNWRMAGCPKDAVPEPVERPWHAAARAAEESRARAVRKRIEETKWQEV